MMNLGLYRSGIPRESSVLDLCLTANGQLLYTATHLKRVLSSHQMVIQECLLNYSAEHEQKHNNLLKCVKLKPEQKRRVKS